MFEGMPLNLTNLVKHLMSDEKTEFLERLPVVCNLDNDEKVS